MTKDVESAGRRPAPETLTEDKSKVDPKVARTNATEGRRVERPVAPTDVAPPREEPSRDNYGAANRTAQVMEMAERQNANALVIHLPGLDVVIQDRRAERAEQRERPQEREGHRGHDDDHHRAEGRGGHARRAGVAGDAPETSGAIKKAHGSVSAAEAEIALKASKFGGKERSLSPFEKTLIARFEEGMKQAKDSADGQFHFLKKSAGEWTGFFEKFVSRTIQKVVNLEDVQGLLFRGLLQEKGASQKGVMISDVMTAMGTDKFTRISVALSKAQQLALATPGAILTKDALQGAGLGEQLKYLALNPQTAEEGGAQFSKAVTRGMFSSQQLESRVAEHLGLITDFRGAGMPGAMRDADEKRAADRRRRRGGVWSSLFGGDDVQGEGSVFVPWWRWDREERSGFRRWFVVVFGSVIFVVLFFLIIALVRGLRP